MTEQEYNAADGIRRSDLWLMKDSPEKFKYHMDHPEDEDEKNPAFLFGSACHKMVLEPESFEDEYAVAPNVDRRTKAGKEEWMQFCDQNEGKIVLGADDFKTISEMSKAVTVHPLAGRMISGHHEVPFFWIDPDTGEKCKCKADVVKITDRKYVLVDYKTTTDASTETFNKHILRFGYHVQAAMYTEGVQVEVPVRSTGEESPVCGQRDRCWRGCDELRKHGLSRAAPEVSRVQGDGPVARLCRRCGE